ncbi:hypothetical protein MIZ03_3720 [Rhodoferax lithotrophicus]|uniref:Uncharacterized protein n=1 Tax=Rhodoferax lithotrophicus TaxID=2798804 RepID=A0ABM7MR35_9BURK|nr:hypothetical protein MIZ03_3720 [Rhodoferax sp. MIZ03]
MHGVWSRWPAMPMDALISGGEMMARDLLYPSCKKSDVCSDVQLL